MQCHRTPFTKAMCTNAIPTLDLAGERGEAARQLVAALEDPGFLYIKNVQGYDPGRTA
jgi:hypothetical protein